MVGMAAGFTRRRRGWLLQHPGWATLLLTLLLGAAVTFVPEWQAGIGEKWFSQANEARRTVAQICADILVLSGGYLAMERMLQTDKDLELKESCGVDRPLRQGVRAVGGGPGQRRRREGGCHRESAGGHLRAQPHRAGEGERKANDG